MLEVELRNRIDAKSRNDIDTDIDIANEFNHISEREAPSLNARTPQAGHFDLGIDDGSPA